MNYTYKLLPNQPEALGGETTNTILRIEDGAYIPMHTDNTDYQEYLKWIEEGNTPLPAEVIEIQAEQWKRDRLTEYPKHNDCIHALLDGGDTLTELQAKRQEVKNKYPK